MKLYKDGKTETEIHDLKYLGEGNCGKVYYFEDKLLKIYKKGCYPQLKMKREIFEILKQLNQSCIVKLYDCFYKTKSKLNLQTHVDAYTMDYIQSEPMKIIECERKLMIQILKELERTIRELSNYDIIMQDIASRNLILNQNGITIIDPDLFHKRTILYRCSAYRFNKLKLIDYLNCILENQLHEKNKITFRDYIQEKKENTFFQDVLNSLTEETFYESMLIEHEKGFTR